MRISDAVFSCSLLLYELSEKKYFLKTCCFFVQKEYNEKHKRNRLLFSGKREDDFLGRFSC
jgi:hypothetical protein